MRAAVLHAPGDIRIEERDVPVPAADEALVRVVLNGLCGTDVTEYTKGPMMVPLTKRHPGSGHLGPTVLGHEFIGEVVGAGGAAQQWMGRRVASGAGVSCGRCRTCLRGRTNLCERYYTLGLSTDGALAEYVAVPVSTLREIPQACTDIEAALAQPLAVGLHAVTRAGIEPGDTVLLIGAGAIGSFILAGLAGHEGRVIAVDVDPVRLECAAALGADETCLVTTDDPTAGLAELLPRGADVTIECSGVPGAAQRAVGLTSIGGTVLLVGLTRAPQELGLADLVLRELTVRTTVAHICDADLPRALDLLAERPLSDLLVDRVVSLDALVSEAMDPLAAGVVGGKVLVNPRRG